MGVGVVKVIFKNALFLIGLGFRVWFVGARSYCGISGPLGPRDLCKGWARCNSTFFLQAQRFHKQILVKTYSSCPTSLEQESRPNGNYLEIVSTFAWKKSSNPLLGSADCLRVSH